jgi:2,4-dienoyl-CoA reductase (NADPH2)
MRGGAFRKGGVLGALAPLARRFVTPSRIRRLLHGKYPVGASVAVIGGQFAGCSLALLLAQMGKQVTVIEESEHHGGNLESNTLAGLGHEVAAGRVKVLTSSRVVEVAPNGIVVADAQGATRLIEVATVLVALDLLPGGAAVANRLGAKHRVRTIGDARTFARIPNAVAEGYAAACEIA